MSLVEVLIALGMVGVLTSVIATVMGQMQKAQNQVNVLSTIENMRINIQKLAADGTAWRATVLNPENNGAGRVLNCVQFNSLCTDSGASGINVETTDNATIDAPPFFNLTHLSQASGGSYIDSTLPDSGYTDKGEPCTGWSANGNDNCPIRWKIKAALECQGAPTCLNPTIRVVGVLYYRAAGANDTKKVVNETKYRVDIRRGARGDTRAERFAASYQRQGAGNDGGPCAATGTVIPLNILDVNENGNVALDTATGLMVFRAGTYTCSANSSCLSCGAVSIVFEVGGAVTHRSSKISSRNWQQTQVNISQATFTINADTGFRFIQICDAVPGTLETPPVSLAQYGLGVALPDYSVPTKFSEIQCTRIF